MKHKYFRCTLACCGVIIENKYFENFFFPEQTFTVNYKNRHEWMTPERNTMANISKQNPDNSDLHNEYKKFRNDLTSALRNAQLEHHSKELDLTI